MVLVSFWIRPNDTDPTGSGSATLKSTMWINKKIRWAPDPDQC